MFGYNKSEVLELRVKIQDLETALEQATYGNQVYKERLEREIEAALNISEGIKNGKVQTIVVPSNMTGLMIGK